MKYFHLLTFAALFSLVAAEFSEEELTIRECFTENERETPTCGGYTSLEKMAGCACTADDLYWQSLMSCMTILMPSAIIQSKDSICEEFESPAKPYPVAEDIDDDRASTCMVETQKHVPICLEYDSIEELKECIILSEDFSFWELTWECYRYYEVYSREYFWYFYFGYSFQEPAPETGVDPEPVENGENENTEIKPEPVEASKEAILSQTSNKDESVDKPETQTSVNEDLVSTDLYELESPTQGGDKYIPTTTQVLTTT